MPVKYSGVLKFTDEIKAEIDLAADGTVEKAVVIDGDGVETPIGGGTTSDYTTATVTFTNNLASAVDVAAASATKNHGSDTIFPVTSIAPSATKTITVVLYKGSSACTVIPPIGPGVEATVTGSIEDNGSFFEISGNGAITVAATE